MRNVIRVLCDPIQCFLIMRPKLQGLCDGHTTPHFPTKSKAGSAVEPWKLGKIEVGNSRIICSKVTHFQHHVMLRVSWTYYLVFLRRPNFPSQ